LVVLLLFAVALAYLPSLDVGYLFDDHDALELNPYLRDAASFRWLFLVPENSALIARPFLSWTFGAGALLFGHDAAIHHFFNLIVHLANVVLVAVLARRGLEHADVGEPLRSAASLGIALVWGVHPLNVQAVAYLVQRSESLATLLELTTLYAWLRAGEPRKGRGWQIVACACPLLAAATKEHGWIAPLLPLLWAWIFQARTPLAELRARPPFYAAGLASWALLAGLTASGGRLAHVGAEPGIDAWSYFLTQPEVLTHYLRLFLVPIGQSFDYDWPPATLATAWPWLALWAALFAATAFAVWRRLPAAFPAAVAFVSLATSSSFLPLPDPAFEHRFYLAGACVAALLVGALAVLARRTPLVLYTGVGCAALALAVPTWQRCTLFQSELAVWSEAVERNPAQRRALSNIGGILLKQGKPAEALAAFARVEELGIPSRMQTRIQFQTGNALFDLGRYAEARERYLLALETINGDPGPIYMNLGHAYLQDAKPAEARSMFERALATLDGNASLHFDLAYACVELRDLECAGRAYERGLRLGGTPQPALAQAMAIFRPDLR
jgi:tetratricopeptide (TPR) repeat protein